MWKFKRSGTFIKVETTGSWSARRVCGTAPSRQLSTINNRGLQVECHMLLHGLLSACMLNTDELIYVNLRRLHAGG